MTVCSIDLRVGGNYHMVFVTEDGTECSFRGTYLEIERPTRIVDTWLFEGWPDAEAVETVELHETDGVTKVKMNLAFRDQAGRDHMTTTDGQEDSWDKMEDYLRSLVGSKWNCLWYLRFEPDAPLARARLIRNGAPSPSPRSIGLACFVQNFFARGSPLSRPRSARSQFLVMRGALCDVNCAHCWAAL